MKLASLKGGRDGRLVVVSNDLAWFTEAHHIAPTLQVALDHWEGMEPALRGLRTIQAVGRKVATNSFIARELDLCRHLARRVIHLVAAVRPD